MRWLALATLLIAGAIYCLLFYPPVVLEGKTEAALDRLATSVQLKDRDAVAASFNQLLTADAAIKLDVNFLSFGTQAPKNSLVQEFDKSQFILFIDNVLYPLTNYGYQPELQDFTLSDDRKTAHVTFSSQQWAEGASLMGGVRLGMRYNSHADCKGRVAFEESGVLLKEASCTVSLRPTPTESPSEILKKLEP